MKESMLVRTPRPSASHVGVMEKPVAANVAPDSSGDAARFWDGMMLSAVPSADASAQTMAVSAELRCVLRLFEAAADGSHTGRPSAPSAGALYPYEHYAVVRAPDGPAVYAVDTARRTCRLIRAGARVQHVLEISGLPLCETGRSLVLTVVRPWLSMRKYGDRGYLYAQLDAAHVATQLLCVASDSHGPAELHARLDTQPLSQLLGLDDGHRFVHSALVVSSRAAACDDTDGGWSCTDDLGGGPSGNSSTWLETECWNWLNSHRPRGEAGPPNAVSLRPLLQPTASGPTWLPAEGTLTALAARRRSTKDFSPRELSGQALDRALAALRTPLATDLTADSELGATLVARRVRGYAPGNHPLFTQAPQTTASTTGLDGNTLVQACMGQEHLRHASALVVFHAPRHEVLRHGGHGLDETLLRAGALAHLLYLGAAGQDIAVTAIGGFDAARWHTLAELPERHEVLYIALLGLPGHTAVKLDRLQHAYAHNER